MRFFPKLSYKFNCTKLLVDISKQYSYLYRNKMSKLLNIAVKEKDKNKWNTLSTLKMDPKTTEIRQWGINERTGKWKKLKQ